MKSWSHTFKNETTLRKFVDEHDIGAYDTVLVQVSTAMKEEKAIDRMIEAVKNALPQATVVGAGSLFQFSDEKIVFDRSVLSITVFEKSRIESVRGVFCKNDQEGYRQTAEKIANRIDERTKGILVLSNAVNCDVEKFFDACNSLFPHIPIFGGIASIHEVADRFILFDKNGIFEEEGILAVLFKSDVLQIHCGHFFDWVPIGREYTVTKADGRYLYELDGEHVLKVYSKYFGELDENKLTNLALAHPLIRQSKKYGPLGRALLKVDEEKVLFTGEFKEGEKVQIGFGHYKQMMDKIGIIPRNYRDLPAEAAWFYICLSYSSGYMDILRQAAKHFADYDKTFLMAMYGEFTQVQGRNFLMNFTLTRVALSEDPDARMPLREVPLKKYAKDTLLETLSTLVESSTKEIMSLNKNLEKEVEKRTKELATLNAMLEKRVELEVKKNREKDKLLYHQSKQAALGEMLSNIAHQWRQPLNIIGLLMQDLSLKAQLGTVGIEEIKETEAKIGENLNYLSDTIDDFRSFVVEDDRSDKERIVDVVSTIEEVVRLSFTLIESKNIELKISLPSEPVMIHGHANDLKQVLLNLIYNAVDILVEKKIENPVIKIETKRNKNKVFIIVRDNGGGIDPKIIDKVFEPYFTTKHRARGTGLGLYMSKMIVEKRLHGHISVRNTPKGAAFLIELPLANVVE